MSLKKIVSGGQTGADIAGIDAAIVSGLQYGGWLPKGRKTENGPLDLRYTSMTEMSVGDYQEMTEQNIKDSDGTVIFTHGKYTGVSELTRKYAEKHNKPVLHLDLDFVGELTAIESVIEWIYKHDIEVLNVAGSRESKDEYIYDDVHSIIKSILNTLKTAVVADTSQTPPAAEASLQESVIATPPVDTKEVATNKEKEQEEGTSRVSGLTSLFAGWAAIIHKKLIEGWEKLVHVKLIKPWPKIGQKNYIFIVLGILILTIALMVMPGGFKKNSSEGTAAKSGTLSKSQDPKTRDRSRDTTQTGEQIPEPQVSSVMQSTINSPETIASKTTLSDSKAPTNSQVESLKNKPDMNTDSMSPESDQLEKKENEPDQSLSDASGGTEKGEPHKVSPKRNPSKNRNRCGSLYKKIASGDVLKKVEAKFLANNCK